MMENDRKKGRKKEDNQPEYDSFLDQINEYYSGNFDPDDYYDYHGDSDDYYDHRR